MVTQTTKEFIYLLSIHYFIRTNANQITGLPPHVTFGFLFPFIFNVTPFDPPIVHPLLFAALFAPVPPELVFHLTVPDPDPPGIVHPLLPPVPVFIPGTPNPGPVL